MKTFLPILLLAITSCAYGAPKKAGAIISIGAGGTLVYAADEHGNRVPDFSSCGYAGGDRPIPDAPVRVVVSSV